MGQAAFYAHFASKDDLVANVAADQLRAQRESLGALASGRAGIEQFVRAYLSVEHRDNIEDGWSSAALLDEIGRCADATKRAYANGMLSLVDDLAARLAPHDPQSARIDSRHAATVPRPGRPTTRRRDARPGHPEHPHTGPHRAAALT